VQGLARFGYGKLTEACYLLLRIRDADAARAWIAGAVASVSTAEYRETAPETALQIAFTVSGLRALGVPERTVSGFSAEFLTGMSGDGNRSRRLGDIGQNEPKNWWWGGPSGDVHVLVMLFAKQNLEGWKREVQKAPWDQAFDIQSPILTTADFGGLEPFGFTDGISQPEFDWEGGQASVSDTIAYRNKVALGEILLGHPNEYGNYTDRPLLDTTDDPADLLLPAEDHTASKDLARDGTYLVLRQLEQDVRGFWKYLDGAAGSDPAERLRLGAAMVGRTTDGDPLIPASPQDVEEPGVPRNGFTYDKDRAGTQCPFGAHIRRANPRNADMFGRPADPITKILGMLGLPAPGLRDDLVASTRFHRILRRGREYGKKLSLEEALQPPGAGEQACGLQFACVCANISRQFEFVQNSWLMSTKFDCLSEESDPLLGNRAAVGNCPTGNFSIPREGKVTRRLTGVPQFVTVRGGAYFFLPSIRALRYIAQSRKTGSAPQE
jgi:deferrochelatase/peroxidase EfeB